MVLILLTETVDHKVSLGRFDMTDRWRTCCLGMLPEKDRKKYTYMYVYVYLVCISECLNCSLEQEAADKSVTSQADRSHG